MNIKKSIQGLFEDLFIYELINGLNSPICLIFDGVYDIDFFSNQLQQMIHTKITVVQILRGLILVKLDIDNQILNQIFFNFIKLLNYDVSSIFIEESHLKSLQKEIYDLKKNLIYIYFEDKFNENEKQIQNIKDVKKTASLPQKCFFGFSNFTDAVFFYIHVIQTEKIWPVFALLPQKIESIQKNLKKEEKQIIRKNKVLVIGSSYPLFNPIKNLFYIGFIEKITPEPLRKMNASFAYGIKCISDLQISHCYQNESIRTFLGFENKFRCLHVFEYIKNNSDFIDIKIVNEIDKNIMNNIHSDFYYLETSNLTVDCSVLFSLNYKYAFNFINYNNDLSTFYCFDDFNDFVLAKESLKKTRSDKCDYIFKNLKMIDDEEYSILFPNESKKNNFTFIIFRMKNINEVNKDKKPKLDNFLKEFSSFRSDVNCEINGKKYIVVGFEKIDQRNKAFLLFKNSKYFSVIKSYYPEYLVDPNSDCIENFIEKDSLIQPFINQVSEANLIKISNDSHASSEKIENNPILKQTIDIKTNLKDDENPISLDKIKNNSNSKQSCDINTNSNVFENKNESETKSESNIIKNKNENETKNESNIIKNKNESETKNESNIIKNKNESKKDQKLNDAFSNKNAKKLDGSKERAYKFENENENQQAKGTFTDKKINKNDIIKNKHLINLSSLYKKEKKPIASRNFSQTYIVSHIISQKKYVVKTFTTKQTSYNNFFNDIEFYCCFNNPALLQIHGYNKRDFDNKKIPTVLFDYMPNGSLQNLAKHINNTEKYTILLTIAYGMKYIHLQGVVHRNLKPENILFDSQFVPKICDYSWSNITDSELLSDQKCNRIVYIAPEILFRNASYSFKSDVYSFAFITYKLLTEKEPFPYIKSNDQLSAAIKSGLRPDLSIISDSLICNLLRKCWSDNPNERPTFDEIFNEILSPRFRLAFQVNDKDILNYLDKYQIETPFNKMDEESIQKASDSGDVEMMTLYGRMLYFGINCTKNVKKSFYYERKAAKEGNAEAMYFLSHFLNEEEDDAKESQGDSIKFLKEAADKGYEKAIIEYGKQLLLVKGSQVDYKQAAKYLYKSLAFNDVEAIFIYGMMLKRGKGVRVNKRKAAQYFQISADLGNNNSMFEYAQMLHYGDGIDKDVLKAELYYRNAINENKYEAFFGLGIMHIDGSFKFNPNESEQCLKKFASLEKDEIVFNYFNDEFEKMLFNDCSKSDYYDFAQHLKKMAECNSQNHNESTFSNGILSVDGMKGAVSSIFQMAGGIIKSVFSGFNGNDNNKDDSDDVINYRIITNLNNQINQIIQREKSKSIEEVKINNYPIFIDDEEVSFYLSNVSVPRKLRESIKKMVEKIEGKITQNVCRFNDPNSLCTFYTFSSHDKIFDLSFILFEKSYQYRLNFMPINESCLNFEENLIPQEVLPEFIAYLRKIPLIKKIHQKVFDGKKICTYLLISEENKIIVNSLVRDFLLQKNVLFDSLKYPLENTMIIKEQFILQNKIDFEIIVNEIKSIKSIDIINIERNKLYLYYNNYLNNMFLKSSFICFKNKIDKMIALNHLNKILFNGNNNILNYDLNLHYASIDETFYKKEARKFIPSIFQNSRGFCEFQQNVLSIESPVPRSYIGFDSMDNLKNCYSKFKLKLKIMVIGKDVDISKIDDYPYQNEYYSEEEYLFYHNL